MIRTSATHPLEIGHVAPAGARGRIGMTFCPGKHQPDSATGHWQRDLDADVAAVAAWGARALVCLVEPHELETLRVPGLGDAVRAAGLEFHHLPIRDAGVPDARFETLWAWSGARLRAMLARGGDVVVHCKGGLGRTGLLAARLLAELGEDPQRAVARVRDARPGAIETEAQRRHVLAVRALDPTEGGAQPSGTERVLGCILGGAVGDALGYRVEFKSLDDIRALHGPDGVGEPLDEHGRCVVSDDTQMTLFTLEALNDCLADGRVGDASAVTARVRAAYLDWLITQTSRDAAPPPSDTGSRLLGAREMHVQRAPGQTCLAALEDGGRGRPDHAVNDRKGCGGVMRVAPLGLAGDDVDTRLAFDLGARAAAITHTHPTGFVAAGVMAAIVRELHSGCELHDAADTALAIARRWSGNEETVAAAGRALALARERGGRHEERVASLGLGWVAEEALAIGLYAALAGRDFPEVLRIAANHDGDSDSTASIAGQIHGAWKGPWTLPHDWVARIDVLEPALGEIGRLCDRHRRGSAPEGRC